MKREYPDDSLEKKLEDLSLMRAELRSKKKAYRDSTKTLRESIKGLEAIITDEVLKLGKTVTVGNIRAKYVPTVIIEIKKEECNGK